LTIIAWDGKSLAADRLQTMGDTLATARKIWQQEGGGAVAISGDLTHGLLMKRWYCTPGCTEPPWPKPVEGTGHTIMVVADGAGCRYFESGEHHIAIDVIDKIAAWGVGREVALGAMEMGATAKQAVEIASKWCAGCGRGVDVVHVSTGAESAAHDPVYYAGMEWFEHE